MALRRILLVLILLNFPIWGATNALSEENSSSGSPEAGSSVEEISSKEVVSISSEDVGPLDHWEEASSEESSVEVGPDILPNDNSVEIVEPTAIPAPKYHFPVVGAEQSILKKTQKSRLEKAEKKLQAIVDKEQQARLAEANKDPRGESEIRICSANFNGLGTKEENQRLLKKIPKPRLAKAQSSVLKAIVSANCDVVAVQGVIGRSPPFATEALTAFATKLSKKTNKVPWKVEIAHSKEQNGYQGFLIKDAENSAIIGQHVDTISNSIMKIPGHPLKTTGVLKNEYVPRDFLKLTLEVKSNDEIKPEPLSLETKNSKKPSREIVIINGILAKGVAPFEADESLLKLQIADVAVRLFEAEQSRISPNEQPIVLAVVERVEGVLGAAQKILSGRIKIDDFANNGDCKILTNAVPAPHAESEEVSTEEPVEESGEEPEKKPKKIEKSKPVKKVEFTVDTAIECKILMERPQPRFDVLQTVPFEELPKHARDDTKKAPKIPKRDIELQTAGIFVVSADLKYSAKKRTNLLDSSAGRIQISNGLPGAYLVWVDLNW